MEADARASGKIGVEDLREELRRLDEYLDRVEREDKIEDEEYGEEGEGDGLPKSLEKVELRRKKLAEALESLEKDRAEQMAGGKRKLRKDVIVSDPDAVWVKKKGRIVPGYTGQVAADEMGMIVAVKAKRTQDDREELVPMIEQIERRVGEPAQRLVADSGYYSESVLVCADQTGTEVVIPDNRTAAQINREGHSQEPDKYHVDGFGYDERQNTFVCPAGHLLKKVKHHRRRGSPTIIYRGTKCERCTKRGECTRDRQGYRTVEVHEEYRIIRRAHERFRSPEGQMLYRRRKTIIEPIFGQWQYNLGVRRLRLRRLSGFDIELHLLAIAHNLRKFRKWGVKLNQN